jgi:hypothetical protein
MITIQGSRKMRNGLRLFEKFESVYLEVCVPDEHKQRFEHDYGLRTGFTPQSYVDGYNTRHRKKKYNAWGIEFRVYFKNSCDFLIDSLSKLGFHTEISDKLIAVEFNGEHPEHGYKHRVSNQELFWWLIDYGYRLGENQPISYDYYLMKKHIKEMEVEPLFDINNYESENPIDEAMLLVA